MVTIVGSGKYKYELVEGWLKLPEYFYLDEHHRNSIWDVACDSRDRVFLFATGNHPVIILDKSSSFISCWGEGHFANPHGICIDPDDSVFLVDRRSHIVEKYAPDGKLLLTLGKRDWAQAVIFGQPFNLPSGVTVSSSGDIFVSDGYGNSRIHKFSPDGELVKSWGEAGSEPSQFAVPHSVVVDRHGTVYVCDRHNHRIQLFTSDGEFITMWTDFQYPEDIYIDQREDIVYIIQGFNTPEIRPRLSIHDLRGDVLAEWGGRKSQGEGVMNNPHGIWVDSQGDIYVADDEPDAHCILKFVRIRK